MNRRDLIGLRRDEMDIFKVATHVRGKETHAIATKEHIASHCVSHPIKVDAN
jgi:hypothetical protein